MVASILYLSAVLLCSWITYLYVSFRRRYTYWRDRNIPYLEPTFPFGNVYQLMKKRHFGHLSQDLYNQLKAPNRDYAGLFFYKMPCLLVLSPEFAKIVLVRDFAAFVDRGLYYNKQDDPLSGNMFFVEGDDWHKLRSKISPTFTSAKMKLMFRTVQGIASLLTGSLATRLDSNGPQATELDMCDYVSRFTTDVIGACAFGIECDSIRNPDSEFRALGKKMFTFSKAQLIKLSLSMFLRDEARRLRVQFNSTELNEEVLQMVRNTIEQRRQSNERRDDFMQLMINMHNENDEAAEDGLTLKEIAAQCFLFFFAGFETTSSTMAYALYELALQPDIQRKLQAEIHEAVRECGEDGFTYEQIMNGMPYLDRVFCETVRKYPSVSSLHRVVNQNYTMPNGSILTAGTTVIIPNYALQNDPDLFPQPDRFDPERFTDEQRNDRHPYAYLPFGEGPRKCIGMRFGVMQAKLGLAHLLRRFRFEACARTEDQIVINPVSLLFVPLNGVHLRVTKYQHEDE